MLKILVLATVVVSHSGVAQARVFNFKSETIAAYFRGSISQSRLARSPYDNSSGISTEFVGDEHLYNYSGEIGFLMNIGEFATFRVGGEVIQAKNSDVIGNNAAGTKLFDLESDVFVFNTTSTIEWHLYRGASSRLSLFGGIGLGAVNLDVDYTFTAAGLSAFGLTKDYSEQSGKYIIGGHGGVQYELLFADTATIAFELGFRHLPVPILENEKDNSTISGAVTTGSQTLNQDGSDRTLDLSGYYFAMAFRFYLDVM